LRTAFFQPACRRCGVKLHPSDDVCPNCGKQVKGASYTIAVFFLICVALLLAVIWWPEVERWYGTLFGGTVLPVTALDLPPEIPPR